MFGVLVNPNEPASESQINDAQSAARAVGQRLHTLKARSEHEIDDAFATLSGQGANALLLGANRSTGFGDFKSVMRNPSSRDPTRHSHKSLYDRRAVMPAMGQRNLRMRHISFDG